MRPRVLFSGRTVLASLAVVASLLGASCEGRRTATPELQAVLSAAPPKGVAKDVWKDVTAFYEGRQRVAAWTVADGVIERTYAALDVLRAADRHGLDPATYGEPELRAAVEKIAAAEGEDPGRAQQIADLDTRITTSLMRLGRHVATGRLAPTSIDSRWNVKRAPPDYVAALQQAAEGDVASFLPAIEPRHPEYKALRDKIAALRGQEKRGWPQVPTGTVKIGQWNEAVVVPLRQRLVASGYLPEGTPLDNAQFDATLETAVKTFQQHHGLAPTGVLDRATIQRMNVPIEARIAQVAINLERWRWMPDDLGDRHFIVNVPYFHLIAREGGKPVLDIRVVVGKRGNETPLFSDEMETVVFSPYWNVPETIASEETAPAIQRDPDFLARNNMEVVDSAGRVVDAEAIPWGDEGLMEGYRFRQRPGAGNALGFVKFLFPNEHAVYLHDTPADALFKRIGRAFSHGCVRVEEPERLAEYVLRDQAEWTGDAIRSAMRAGEERHVRLKDKIPVHIIYMTAWVDDNGGLHFQDDVYGLDARQSRM